MPQVSQTLKQQLRRNIQRLLADRGLPSADLTLSIGKDTLTLADLATIAASLNRKISDLFQPPEQKAKATAK